MLLKSSKGLPGKLANEIEFVAGAMVTRGEPVSKVMQMKMKAVSWPCRLIDS
jgi:hypothetical protein